MLRALLVRPFLSYERALERHPVTTKSLTSGLLSGIGDVIAQRASHAHAESEAKDKAAAAGKTHTPRKFKIEWQRVWVMAAFGVTAGPIYHVWFNQLDRLPALALRLRQTRTRAELIRAFYVFKKHGIEVPGFSFDKLPSATPLGKWSEKGLKIAADQFLFSTVFTAFVFMFLGVGNGGVDKLRAEAAASYIDDFDDELHRLTEAATSADDAGEAAAKAAAEARIAKIEEVIAMLRSQHTAVPSWTDIVDKSWEHTKHVFWPTYAADCALWPVVQFFNFSYVPPRYRVMLVNAVNVGWFAFLAFQGSSH